MFFSSFWNFIVLLECDTKTCLPSASYILQLLDKDVVPQYSAFRGKARLKDPLFSPTVLLATCYPVLLFATPRTQRFVRQCWHDLKWSRLKITLKKGYFQWSHLSCAPTNSCCGITEGGKPQRKSWTTQPEVGGSSWSQRVVVLCRQSQQQDGLCCH